MKQGDGLFIKAGLVCSSHCVTRHLTTVCATRRPCIHVPASWRHKLCRVTGRGPTSVACHEPSVAGCFVHTPCARAHNAIDAPSSGRVLHVLRCGHEHLVACGSAVRPHPADMHTCVRVCLQACREVAKEFPRVAYEEVIVDNTCMQLVNRWVVGAWASRWAGEYRMHLRSLVPVVLGACLFVCFSDPVIYMMMWALRCVLAGTWAVVCVGQRT